MKERPILMNGAMVRAVLNGTKTQTRRLVSPQPLNGWEFETPPVLGKITSPHQKKDKFGVFIRRGVGTDFPETDIITCPYGQPGDRLWVRENFQPLFADGIDDWRETDWKTGEGYAVSYPATDGIQEFIDTDDNFSCAVKPSIHMPRWASRILLEIDSVRVERLQDISESDAEAEGCSNTLHLSGGRFANENFAHLWWTINGDGSWESNPWVWVIEFKTVKP